MKICIFGMGSIGKRHLLNITHLLDQRDISYSVDVVTRQVRPVDVTLDKLINHYYKDEFPEENYYDIIFITNPTSMHFKTILKVKDKARAVFIEKPLFESSKYAIDQFEKNELKCYVACPLRHLSIMKYMKETILSEEIVLSARAISSSYLPHWRKNQDYRDTYSSKRELGGGVSLDLIHEWDYLCDLFGFPEKTYHLKDKVSELEIDSDDISVYISKYKDKIVEVHLDYFGRVDERKLTLLTTRHRIEVDFIENTILYDGKEMHPFPKEDAYVNEMNYFLDYVLYGGININTIRNAYEVLKLTE